MCQVIRCLPVVVVPTHAFETLKVQTVNPWIATTTLATQVISKQIAALNEALAVLSVWSVD